MMLYAAQEKIFISSGEYTANKMQVRNKWIVDHCDKLLACYDGTSVGGTLNCIKYAKNVGKDIIYINII